MLYLSLFWQTLNLFSACGSSSAKPCFIMQNTSHFLSTLYCCYWYDWLHTHIYSSTYLLHICVQKLCMFPNAPFDLLLFMLLFFFDLSHYYLLLQPNSLPGMTKTNLVYWYLPVALSCIILTNCSELTSAPYTVFSLPVPEASGFTDCVCLCVHPYLAPLCMNHLYLWSVPFKKTAPF